MLSIPELLRNFVDSHSTTRKADIDLARSDKEKVALQIGPRNHDTNNYPMVWRPYT